MDWTVYWFMLPVATLPGLVRRSHFPIAVAAATSTVVVAGTVVGAATVHMAQLAVDGGLAAIPWNLIVWAAPGAVLGAILGTGLQGKVSPRVTRWFFSALFLNHRGHVPAGLHSLREQLQLTRSAIASDWIPAGAGSER